MQEQETMPLLTSSRRFDDPPLADFTLKRHKSLETLWLNRFNELTERDQTLSSTLAHVETTAAATKIELQEQLTTIINTLSQMNHLSNKIENLQQKVNERREKYDEIKANEIRLEALISILEGKIASLEDTNRYLRRERILVNINIVALIILTALVFYHVLFE